MPVRPQFVVERRLARSRVSNIMVSPSKARRLNTDSSGSRFTRLGRCLLSTAFAWLLLSPVRRAAPPPERPNIIFILLDDLRWDEMDYPFVKAPNIQRIAREGVRFRNAFTTTPLCSPSRASFLTGQYAHKHGIKDNT